MELEKDRAPVTLNVRSQAVAGRGCVICGAAVVLVRASASAYDDRICSGCRTQSGHFDLTDWEPTYPDGSHYD